MNEVAASLLIVYFSEALYIQKNNDIQKEGTSEEVVKTAKYFYDLENADSDIFFCFEKIMAAGHMEMFSHSNADKAKRTDINLNSKKATAILQRVSRI